MDKLKLFPNQLSQGDPSECVALTVCDLAGNILGIPFSSDFTYAATLNLEGITPNTAGSDPWTGLQSAVGYGLLPAKDEPFTSQTIGELYCANFANYSPALKKEALQYQMLAPFNVGVNFDAMVTRMKLTGNGVMLPLTWFSSFMTTGADGVMPTPSGETTDHCVAAYLDTNGDVLIKPWIGSTWGKGGYGILTRELFNTIVADVFDFDPAGNHWLAILTICLTKFPFLSSYLPALITDGSTVVDPDFLYSDWTTSEPNAHHNVRAMCDLSGLNWKQKQILAACVKQESSFMNWYSNGTPVSHQNFVYENGVRTLSSTDWGLVEINDFWHIGAGKDFPSVDYVVNNPQASVQFMIDYYKANGNLNAWDSFLSGAYLKYLDQV